MKICLMGFKGPVPVLILVFGLIIQCETKPDSKDMDRNIRHWAALYCEARELRERRFALSDLMRNTEDSMKISFPGQPNGIYSSRLDSLKALVGPLMDRSAVLADSISNLQQNLYAQASHSATERQKLDQAFKKAVLEICP